MNTPAPRSFIHYDLERVDYALSESELEQFKAAAANNWKDFTVACTGIGIPCMINAFAAYPSAGNMAFAANFLLNAIGATVFLVLAAAFGVQWKRSAVDVESLMSRLKAKPKMALPNVTNVGSLS